MLSSSTNKTRDPQRWFASLALRSQLLLAINVPIAILVSLLLALDFRREMSDRIKEKRVALEEEAKTILPTVQHLQHEDIPAIQRYIDDVCARMRDDDSPGHHIAVLLRNQFLQATSHHRASPQVKSAFEQAARSRTSRSFLENREIIVGFSSGSEATVFVSEDAAPLRRSAWYDLLRRGGGLLTLAVFATVALNAVLMRLVTVPLSKLVNTVRKIAAGELGAQCNVSSSAELTFLSDEVNAMSTALAKAAEYRERQMAKAREIQQHLIPHNCQFAALEWSSVFQPADEVGGDYFDAISLPGDRTLVCVADATGHGISAAMSTMLVRALLHAATEQTDDLQAIIAFVNRQLVGSTLSSDFATAILVLIDPHRNKLQYASAGHETAFLMSSDRQVRTLESTGLPLGIDEYAEYDVRSYPCRPGDRLLLITDGVTETMGPQDELYGRDRALDLLLRSSQRSIDEVTAGLSRELQQFRAGAPRLDDVTIVLIEIMAKKSPETAV